MTESGLMTEEISMGDRKYMARHNSSVIRSSFHGVDLQRIMDSQSD